ncbi:MAG TPA: hypothetical protein PLX97_06290, partial [Gemmatales bacterium]|nr:hypothetical protein [Gemmatales bacterium]
TREACILVPLAACCLWIGIYPKPFIDVMKPEATALGQRLEKPLHERPASTSVLASPMGGKR